MGRFGSRAGAGKPRSRKRRGILNFALENRRMLWGLERGTWQYTVTSEWKGTREATAILKWVDLQWDYIDL